ncbi:MAG: hypothetical protein IAE82_00885 [Opitutaceae bacterium]|nr:hypothetical protein [Opitutaceae bacterium]
MSGQLLELASEHLSGQLPEVSLQEAYWLVNALTNATLDGAWLEVLPEIVGGIVRDQAFEYPENTAIREEIADFPDAETFERLNALPEYQLGDRIAQLSPVQALALVTIGYSWLGAGDRSDVHSSLAKAFKVRAA